MSEQVGLFGWPVAHSVSPAMHNAAFRVLGLDWEYDLIPTPPEDFVAEVERRLAAGYRGFNCTIPHKRAAIAHPLVDEITPEAQAVGVANTLIVKANGRLRADNTDARGLAQDLRAHAMLPTGQHALILGSGGGAQAAIAALKMLGAASITCLEPLDTAPIPANSDGHAAIMSFDALPTLAPSAGVIIHCTPVGMSPHNDASLWPEEVPFPAGAALYDLIYNPSVTRLMTQAGRAGLRTANGLGMLVWQGVYAFEAWTGVRPPVEVMDAAARAALRMHDHQENRTE